MAERDVIGWDIGGAHVKAARLARGRLVDAVQWPCALWRGSAELEAVYDAARRRWPDLAHAAHALTMTGEMVDHFADREDGVARIAALAAAALPAPRFFAGAAGAAPRWCDAEAAGPCWRAIASANWLATAQHAAAALAGGEGLLVDIGSTTTDLIALRRGHVATPSRRDHERLARGELVYHGVVRTPLAALGPRIAWRGALVNVMNEFFATSADVYRLTGELDPADDQHPAADNGAKTEAGSRARLARMIGLDARDASADEWRAFAHTWRRAQVAELRGQVERVARARGLGDDAVVVAAGCGAFVVPEIVPPRWRRLDYGRDIARAEDAALARRAGVAAPAVAVAALWRDERAATAALPALVEAQPCGS